jgi:hypothetical protein
MVNASHWFYATVITTKHKSNRKLKFRLDIVSVPFVANTQSTQSTLITLTAIPGLEHEYGSDTGLH